jgi:hypothetical protein
VHSLSLDFSGKIAQGPSSTDSLKGDEDEGSSLQGEANRGPDRVTTFSRENRKISGSPPGVPPPAFFTPPK